MFRVQLILGVTAVTALDATASATELSMQLDPFCDNSIRVRVRPAPPAAASASAAAVSWIGPASRGGDRVLCLSEDCTKSESSSGYTKGVVEGYTPGASAPPNSTVDLAVYYQRQHTDNLVAPANSE